jgi:peptidoglycan/xylan/chitin deacetylase (PgdA/CDA1 family)
MKSKYRTTYLLSLFAFAACSSGSGPENTGGQSATGGAAPSSGGVTQTGGKQATGGNTATGGAQATGGSQATGGDQATGGKPATGGKTATGGQVATGGSASGGNNRSGGATATGGVDAGTTPPDAKATGGVTATGGSTPQGGQVSSPFKCVNLSAHPGTTGKAKPSGAAGGLKILDWAGFTGAVSFTFDDNNSSQISNYAKLQATGAKVTFFMVSGWSSATNAVWKTAVADGHEIGNHTKSHSSSASLSDLQAAEDFLKSNLGFTPFTMAAPNGATAWSSVAPSLLIANRGVSNGLIGPRDNTNVFNLPAYIPPTGAKANTMDSEVNAAKSANKWKIFCVHGFTGDGSAYQPVDLNGMTTTMSNAVKNGLWVESMGNVVAYYLGQKAIPASATTNATWTLPEHFPPNMCVRATTTGGTLKQNGAEIPWNDHGYYEISLDAKSLTIE